MMNRLRKRDQGFTLVELLVYSLLLMVVLGIAATLFIRTLEIQRDVTAMADATNTAQLTFAELERDLRNAGWAQISHEGHLLVMNTRTADLVDSTDANSRCVGYFLDNTTDTLHRTVVGADVNSARAASGVSEVAAVAQSWPVARQGMSATGSEGGFAPIGSSLTRHDFVTVALEAATIEHRKPVALEKAISLRPQGGIAEGCS